MNYYESYSLSLKIMILLWKMNQVDTLTLVNFFYNVGAQYVGIVGTAIGTSNNSSSFPKVLLEPVLGLGVGCKYIRYAKDAAEMKSRAATLLALFFASARVVQTTNPAVNAAFGASAGTEIARMREVIQMTNDITRGGGSSVLLEPVITGFDFGQPTQLGIHFYRKQFTENSKIIIDNIFHESTLRRFCYASRYVIPVSRNLISGKIDSIIFLGSASVCVSVVAITVYGALCLFQNVERKRFYAMKDALVDKL